MLDLSRKAVTWMLLSVVLFITLNPRVLLTIPPLNGTLSGIWTPNAPSSQVVVHAIVCALLINLAGGVLKKIGVLKETFSHQEIIEARERRRASGRSEQERDEAARRAAFVRRNQ